jgi:hypothetical protein
MKVTRIAYSSQLNFGKYAALEQQARRLGKVRSLAWHMFGSVNAAWCSDRDLRNLWLRDGTGQTFGVPVNAWKETLRDALSHIGACRDAAKGFREAGRLGADKRSRRAEADVRRTQVKPVDR